MISRKGAKTQRLTPIKRFPTWRLGGCNSRKFFVIRRLAKGQEP